MNNNINNNFIYVLVDLVEQICSTKWGNYKSNLITSNQIKLLKLVFGIYRLSVKLKREYCDFVANFSTGDPPVVAMDETEAASFVDAINDLRAHGGRDCPEYAFTGMLEALYENPEWGSPMYVFTDADPKDATEENIEEVKALAGNSKFGVTINFLTTGNAWHRLQFSLLLERLRKTE